MNDPKTESAAVAYQRILSLEEASALKADTDRFFALVEDEKRQQEEDDAEFGTEPEAKPVRRGRGRPSKGKKLKTIGIDRDIAILMRENAYYRQITIDEYATEVLRNIVKADFEAGPGRELKLASFDRV